jgi:hypothetical protein
LMATIRLGFWFSDARIHISRAHGVTDWFSLLHHFLVRLIVMASSAFIAVRPTRVEHKLGQVEITLLAGDAVRMLGINRASGVKVTVRLLGRADLRD